MSIPEYYLNTDRCLVCLICHKPDNLQHRHICDCNNDWNYHSNCLIEHFKNSKKCPTCNKSIKHQKDLKLEMYLILLNMIAIVTISEILSYHRYNLQQSFTIMYSLICSFLIQSIILYVNYFKISFYEHIHKLILDQYFNKCKIIEIISIIELCTYFLLIILATTFNLINHVETISIIHYMFTTINYYVFMCQNFIHTIPTINVIMTYELLINLGYIYIFDVNKAMTPFIIVAYLINLQVRIYLKYDSVVMPLISYGTFTSNIIFQIYTNVVEYNNMFYYNMVILFLPLVFGYISVFIIITPNY